MIPAAKMKLVAELVAGAAREELIFLQGYLAGLLAGDQEVAGVVPSETKPKKITIAYGTETGNSKKLASEFAAQAKKQGIVPKLVGLDQYRLNDLPKEEFFLTIVSTQGEGEPPQAARKFYDHIHKNGFRLEGVKYGVLALGDTAYPLFCKAGEDVDIQLGKLGGHRILPLQKCDTDYETEAMVWFDQVLQQLAQTERSPSRATGIEVTRKSTGKKIYTGTV